MTCLVVFIIHHSAYSAFIIFLFMRVIVLLNPAAGRGKARGRLAKALDVLRRGGVAPEIRESSSADHLVELAQRARDEKPDMVVSAGGDGTHHYVLNGLWGSDVPLGVLSLGTGNDFANGLGIPVDAPGAGATLLGGHSVWIDLARVGSKVYGCIAGAGFDSIVNRFANDRVRHVHGSLAYAWSILRCIGPFRPQPLELRSDGESFSGEVMFAVVGNSISYGGGLKLTPHARVDDGLLDVCIVPRMTKPELLWWVPRAYHGRHLAHPRIRYFQARTITLQSSSPMELFGDGEFIQELPATIEVAPRALRVIVPRGASGGGA
ncbi:MAG TPA: diacylglycerol kinase family protein [Terriglobia bacterium]|nr:diacylglycerol kinase family protein [Terriglobia bacterium]